MGASFGNLFVRTGQGDADAGGTVAAAIRAHLLANPATTETRDRGADRTIVIATAAGSSWVAVFDELADQGDDEAIVDVGSALSTALRAPVVATSVFDSDLARAWLIDGVVVDQVARPFDVLDEMTGGDSAGWDGDPEAWIARLPGTDPVALAAAWETDDVFAESRVAAAAEVLGIPAGWAVRGLRYLDDLDEPGELTTLRFRVEGSTADDVEPALALGSSPGEDRSPRGEPPAWDGATPVLLELGDEFGPSVMGQVRIAGDLLVVIAGPALADGLVVVDAMRFMEIGSTGPASVDLVDARLGESPARMATLARPPATRTAGRLAGMIALKLAGRAAAVGTGELRVTVGSAAAFVEQQQTLEFDIRVQERPARA